ncbi:MAG: hypothetical protein Q7R83_02470 [bacterium]|nr:hypothetical protein [bacterium]
MNQELIPTLLTDDGDLAVDRLMRLNGAKISPVQIDVLDETLFPFLSWHDAAEFALHDFSLDVVLHLMVQDPQTIIKTWTSVKNLKRVIWHIEAPINHEKLIKQYRKQHLEVGLALAPETPASAILPYKTLIDECLVLGVHPGKSGQAMLKAMIEKAEDVHKLAPKLAIGFDGGIRPTHLKKLAAAGVTRFYSGHLFG